MSDRTNPLGAPLPSVAAYRIRADHYDVGRAEYYDISGNALARTTHSGAPLWLPDRVTGSFRCRYDGIANAGLLPALTIPQPYTIGLVARQLATGGAQLIATNRILDAAGNAFILTQFTAPPQLRAFVAAGGGFVCPNSGADIGEASYIEITVNGASSAIRINNGPPVTGNLGAGGLSATALMLAQGNNSTHAFIDFFELAIWPRAFSSGDRATFVAYMAAQHRLLAQGQEIPPDGTPDQLLRVAQSKRLYGFGDSRSAPGYGNIPRNCLMTSVAASILGPKWGRGMPVGTASAQVASEDAQWGANNTGSDVAGGVGDGSLDNTGIESSIAYLIGTNDLNAGRSAAQIEADMTAACTNRENACPGIYHYVCTEPPRSTLSGPQETQRQNYNAFLRNQTNLQSLVPSGASGRIFLVDVDAIIDPDLGAVAANATWYLNEAGAFIHPNEFFQRAMGHRLAKVILSSRRSSTA